jgi:hypothetical protein
MALTKVTRDHEEIRKWVEERGGIPSEVEGTENNGEPGVLRFKFPNAPNARDEKLKEISWDEFFRKFDEKGLALVYEERTADGKLSYFNKLVYPEDAEHPGSKSSESAKKTDAQQTKSSKPHKAA